jgi:hypothetical protein
MVTEGDVTNTSASVENEQGALAVDLDGPGLHQAIHDELGLPSSANCGGIVVGRQDGDVAALLARGERGQGGGGNRAGLHLGDCCWSRSRCRKGSTTFQSLEARSRQEGRLPGCRDAGRGDPTIKVLGERGICLTPRRKLVSRAAVPVWMVLCPSKTPLAGPGGRRRETGTDVRRSSRQGLQWATMGRWRGWQVGHQGAQHRWQDSSRWTAGIVGWDRRLLRWLCASEVAGGKPTPRGAEPTQARRRRKAKEPSGRSGTPPRFTEGKERWRPPAGGRLRVRFRQDPCCFGLEKTILEGRRAARYRFWYDDGARNLGALLTGWAAMWRGVVVWSGSAVGLDVDVGDSDDWW